MGTRSNAGQGGAKSRRDRSDYSVPQTTPKKTAHVKLGAVKIPTATKVITKTRNGEVVEISISDRAATAAKALGSRARLAEVLKVSASQPTRWISGDEAPNSENTRAIVDLEHVITRARLLWGDDDTVSSWLNGRNAFLGGARPVDVIATEGSSPVIDALDQEMAGGFA